jgi:hypothetical protein
VKKKNKLEEDSYENMNGEGEGIFEYTGKVSKLLIQKL